MTEGLQRFKCWSGASIYIWLVAFTAAGLLLCPHPADAVFDRLTVQGQLRDSTNSILTGNYNFSFSIYTAATGGTNVFQQNFTNMAVDSNGMYTAVLTSVSLPFSQDYYLGVAVNGQAEMAPRFNLTDTGTAFRSNRSEYLGSYSTSYFLNTSSDMQTIGGNLTVANTLFVGSGGYGSGGLTANSAGNLYVGGNLYITGSMIPVNELRINGSNVPDLDDLFLLGNTTNRWKTAYIGTGGINSSGDVRTFSGAGYVNLTASTGALQASGNATAANLIATTGLSIGGDYRTSWPTGTGNTSAQIWTVVDNGTFLKLTGGTMTGILAINANLTVDTSDLFVDSTTGRVGIGTATPSAVLHIRSPSAAGVINLSGFSDGTNYAALEMWNLSTNRGWRVAHRTAGSFAAEYYGGSSWSSPIVILTDGNVSIGASGTPYTKLDVGGSVNVTGSVYVANGSICVNSSGTCATMQAGNVSAKSVIATTGLSIGGSYRTTWPSIMGNTSAEIFAVVDNSTFLKLSGGTMTGNLLLNANLTVDTSDLVVDSANGRVGIGTSAPSEKVQVAGGNVMQTAGNPSLEGSYINSAYLDGASSVYVYGKYAYVASEKSDSLTVIDVSNPASPSYVGNYSSATYLDGAVSVQVTGKYAYVTSWYSAALTIVDISNPSAPAYVGSYSSSTHLNGARSVYVSGKYAYVASYGSKSLTIIDVSNPSSPSYAGNYSSGAYLDGASSVQVSGKYAYVASFSSGLAIFDVSNALSPAYVGNYNSSTYVSGSEGVYVSGKYAYVTSVNNRLTIINVSNPANPTYVGSYSNATCLGGANAVHVSGKYAYVTAYSDDSFVVIDVSNPQTPSLSGWYSDPTYTNYTTAVYVSGKYAYVSAWESDSMDVIDISGIDAPSASIGDIASSSIEVSENLDVRGDIYAGSGLVVGPGGILSQGPLAVSSGDSYFGGNVGIGVKTPQHKLTVAGDINITANNNKVYYGSGGEQYYNGTCMLIKGATNTVELC